MSGPSKNDILGMDFSFQAKPFVENGTKHSVDLYSMDWSYQSQPFVSNVEITTGESSSSSSSSSTSLVYSSSSSELSELSDGTKKKKANLYRFSGYNLPTIQLDETGHSYYYIDRPHPYYSHQPTYWQKPQGSGAVGAPCVIDSNQAPQPPKPQTKPQTGGLYPLV